MSRCYPFPLPGYVRDESVIESIKGAKEEVKREKKDRKHKKEKKRKERDNEADGSKKHRHKRPRKEEGVVASKKVGDDGRGLIKSEVEKSCLTVELELQTSSQNSCDSTLHSNERPKQVQSQPLDCGHNDSDPEVMMTNKKDQKHRSSRERLNASHAAPSESFGHPYLSSENEAPRDALRVSQQKIRDSNSGSSRETTTEVSKEKKTIPLEENRNICRQLAEEKPTSSHQETVGPSKLCRKCPPSTAVRFLNLIENWAPDRVESISKLTDPEDQEWWLFMKVGAKRHHQVSNQTTSKGSSSTMRQTARFLPEVELHALPFTVPF